jgi:hypothetical protein
VADLFDLDLEISADGKSVIVPREVVSLFVRFAREVKASGHRHYSSDSILHRIRWHMHVERGYREFKCNNNWTSVLSRWTMKNYPDLDGLFETRELHTGDA